MGLIRTREGRVVYFWQRANYFWQGASSRKVGRFPCINTFIEVPCINTFIEYTYNFRNNTGIGSFSYLQYYSSGHSLRKPLSDADKCHKNYIILWNYATSLWAPYLSPTKKFWPPSRTTIIMLQMLVENYLILGPLPPVVIQVMSPILQRPG